MHMEKSNQDKGVYAVGGWCFCISVNNPRNRSFHGTRIDGLSKAWACFYYVIHVLYFAIPQYSRFLPCYLLLGLYVSYPFMSENIQRINNQRRRYRCLERKKTMRCAIRKLFLLVSNKYFCFYKLKKYLNCKIFFDSPCIHLNKFQNISLSYCA